MKLSFALILALLCQWVSADVAHIKDSLADRQYLPPAPARDVPAEQVKQVHRHKPHISAYQYTERPRHTSYLHQQGYEGERYYDYAKSKPQNGRYSSYTPRALEAVEPTNRPSIIQRDFASNLLPNYNLFAPANSNPYARNQDTDRLITAPNSVFHTQINLQSQDNRFNVPNSLPPTSAGAARALEAGYDDGFAARRIPSAYNAGRLVGAFDDAQFNAVGLTQSHISRALSNSQARAFNDAASAQFSRTGVGLTDNAAVSSRSPQLLRTASADSLTTPDAFSTERAVNNLPRPLTNGNNRRSGGAAAVQLPIDSTGAAAQRSLPASSAEAAGVAAGVQGASGASFGNIRGGAGESGASADFQGTNDASFGNIRGAVGASGPSAGLQGASGASIANIRGAPGVAGGSQDTSLGNIRGAAGEAGVSAGSQGMSSASFGNIRGFVGVSGPPASLQGASGASLGNIRGTAGEAGVPAGVHGASGASLENIRGGSGVPGAPASLQGASGASLGNIRGAAGASDVSGARAATTPTPNAALTNSNEARSRDVVASRSASRNVVQNAANGNAAVRTDLRDQRAPVAKKTKSNYQALNLINGNVPADEVTRLATLSRSAPGNAQGVNIFNGNVIAASARPAQVDSQLIADDAFEYAPSDSYAAFIYAQNPYNAALHDRSTAAHTDFRSDGYHYAQPVASSSH